MLLNRWTGLVARLAGGSPAARATWGGAGEVAGRDLLARYAEPARHYHDQLHLTEVLDAVDVLGEHAAGLDAARAAAWFHDAVYDPQAPPGANEESSARLAVDVLSGPDGLGLPADLALRVGDLVRVTATHEVRAGDDDAAVLCDADLAILGSRPGRYAAYCAAVRAEYSHVPDELFRTARAAILQTFVDRPQIYRTPTARARWEPAARSNLAAELTRLRSDAAL